MMKHFLLACLFPTLLTAQNMQLTEQLGKTVLYGDVALSPDGKNVAWVQSTAATTANQTYFRGTAGDASATTIDVIDKAIHNQRIAVVDVATSELRQVSPADLHIYDFDWSPDDKMFVTTAAPGPGDNNWWIAQIYRIDIEKGNATSIYKPSL